MFCFLKASSQTSFRKKWSPITRFISLCTSNFVIFRVFSNIDMLKNFICRFKSEYSMVPKIIASKSMDSQLSNALSNAFIALLLPDISKFQSRKLPLYSPLGAVFTCRTPPPKSRNYIHF